MVGNAQSSGSSPISDASEEHGAARRIAGTRHRKAQVGILDLAGRFASDLSDGLDDIAEPVDVALAQVATARIDREATVWPLEVAIGDEVVELTWLAEAH